MRILAEEVFCDYFAGVRGFWGDWQTYERLFQDYIYILFKRKDESKEKVLKRNPEISIRLTLSCGLFKYIKEEIADLPVFVGEELKNKKLESSSITKGESLACLFAQCLDKNTYFKPLLHSLAQTTFFDNERGEIFEELRGFFKRVSENESFPDWERRRFFHYLWMITCKKAVKEYFEI